MLSILIGECTWDNLPNLIKLYQKSGGFSRGVPGELDLRFVSKRVIFSLDLFIRTKYVERFNNKEEVIPTETAILLMNQDLEVSKEIMIEFLIKNKCNESLIKKLKQNSDLGLTFSHFVKQSIINYNIL